LLGKTVSAVWLPQVAENSGRIVLDLNAAVGKIAIKTLYASSIMAKKC